VRRQVLQILAKVQDAKAREMFIPLLDDPDADIQTEAVRLTTEFKIQNAVPILLLRLTKAESSVQEEICIALGRLGERTAIPHLIKLLETKTSFWRKSAGVADAVRVRAI